MPLRSEPHVPHWIPLSSLSFFDHKLFMKDEVSGLMGSCIPKEDGTFEWKHGDVKPTHYWSF